ncbi:MAG: hypothetical protein OEZ40_01670 [Candidatus Bathyarchaeota archaeon]|nr:hypothetical protein [Candidatus Bathyarchaeota archaeon]
MSIEEASNVEATGTQTQLTKKEFMVACKADGTAEEVCDARWKAAHEVSPTVPPAAESPASTGAPTMGDLVRENEMLRSRVKTRETQLRQAIEIANRANDERKAKDHAEKEQLISSIQMDSHFSKDELDKKTLGELQTMRLTLDKSIEKTFASVAAEIDEAGRKREPYLTAGAWDSQKKQWVGGT